MDSIQFLYLVKGEGSWRSLDLQLSDYFEEEDGIPLDLDSPVRLAHFAHHLGPLLDSTIAIRLLLFVGGGIREFRQTFWGENGSNIVEIIEPNSQYRELILSLEVPAQPDSRLTLRLTDFEGRLIPTLHTLTNVPASGIETSLSLNLKDEKDILRLAGRMFP